MLRSTMPEPSENNVRHVDVGAAADKLQILRRSLTALSVANITAILILLFFSSANRHGASRALGWLVFGLPVCFGWLGLVCLCIELAVHLRTPRPRAATRLLLRLFLPGLSLFLAAVALTEPFSGFLFALPATVASSVTVASLRFLPSERSVPRKVSSRTSLVNLAAILVVNGIFTCWHRPPGRALGFFIIAAFCAASVGAGCFLAELVIFFARGRDIPGKRLALRLATPTTSVLVAGFQVLATIASVAGYA